MKINIKERKRQISDSYSEEVVNIAYDFSKKAYAEFKQFIKAIVLFGSTARKKHKQTSDIDILLIIDDIGVVLDRQLIQAFRLMLQKIINDVNPKKLHITTLKYSSFWEYVRAGDPIAVNILRDGFPIIDTGFFEPLQVLLYQGRIRPSAESMWNYFNKAPVTLNNARWHVNQGVLDLYWAVIDSAHAALIKIGEVPPSPSHVADLLDTRLVNKGLLDKKYSEIMRRFYHLSKVIEHGTIENIKGDQFEDYYSQAEEFVNEMKRFLEDEK